LHRWTSPRDSWFVATLGKPAWFFKKVTSLHRWLHVCTRCNLCNIFNHL